MSKGANLVIEVFSQEALDRVSDEIRQAETGKVILQYIDIRDRSKVQLLVDTAIREFGRLGGCANVSGISG